MAAPNIVVSLFLLGVLIVSYYFLIEGPAWLRLRYWSFQGGPVIKRWTENVQLPAVAGGALNAMTRTGHYRLESGWCLFARRQAGGIAVVSPFALAGTIRMTARGAVVTIRLQLGALLLMAYILCTVWLWALLAQGNMLHRTVVAGLSLATGGGVVWLLLRVESAASNGVLEEVKASFQGQVGPS
jgi:hypothetical protein